MSEDNHNQNKEYRKCFIGYSHGAKWHSDIESVCQEVLHDELHLEPWYADDHPDPTKTLREKVVHMIANTCYGIYDISSWRKDEKSEWILPRNVLIEMGIAIGLNRPMLLLRHTSNKDAGLELPYSFEAIQNRIVGFSGKKTLKDALRQHVPLWVNTTPEQDRWNTYCTFGDRECSYRENHPYANMNTRQKLHCHIADGPDSDYIDIRDVISDVLVRYNGVTHTYLNDAPLAEGYTFRPCSYCQEVRSNPFALYRITPRTLADTFIAIGISLALEKQFGYSIPGVLLASDMQDIPSLLAGYEVCVGHNDTETKKSLQKFMPEVLQQTRRTTWKHKPLPFIKIMPRPNSQPNLETVTQQETDVEVEQKQISQEAELQEEVTFPPHIVSGVECPNCKAQNRDGVRYCGNCGKVLNRTTSAPLTTDDNGSGSIVRSLTPGTRLQGGRYEIKKVLGQGGMGAALLATDYRLDSKLVVIKELISENTDPNRVQDDVRNFKREVATLAHIDHPLVPNVTDHFQEGPRYFMVQEYVEGETLEERIDRLHQPMQQRNVLVCASEILDILDYLAQQTPPVVHRDIKPANIIIGAKDRRSRLVDFGIVRADEAKNAQRKQTSALGTPGYAPPEQYQGNADPRSDLYALAATLHHLLTNRDPRNYPPFVYPLVRTLNPQLSPEIEGVLTRALNNDINQRYQSATAMQKDIDEILHKHFGVSSSVNSYVLGSSGQMGEPPMLEGMSNMPPVAPVEPAVDEGELKRPSLLQRGVTALGNLFGIPTTLAERDAERPTAYCVICKEVTTIVNPRHEKTRNNRIVLKGQCEICGTNISKFVAA